jgi:hypothetical protein
MQKNTVIVQHVENGDWALVLIAERSEYGRRSIVPLIFVNDGCGVFATAPQLKLWQKSGLVAIFNPPPDRREEMLSNAVNEWIRQISLHSFIKERSKVGIVARAKARNEQIVPPQNFELNREREPALFWLCERSETASQAIKVLSYLINKNKIGELSQQEREEQGMKLLVDKDILKYLKTQRR